MADEPPKIVISGNKVSNIKLSVIKNNRLYLGSFEKKKRTTILFVNKLPKDVLVDDWRSPCPCIEIVKMPKKIKKDESAELIIDVKPENYSGRITKHMPIVLRYENKKKTIFLPIEFVAGKAIKVEDTDNSKVKTLSWILYDGGKLNNKRYENVSAWLFGGKNCAQCNYLKLHILPKLLKPIEKTVQVNIDQNQGFMLLLDLEKKMKIEKPGKPPILFWKNKLYYGNDAIKKLLVENPNKDLISF